MSLEGINKVFFIGVGGIGMSGLARYFNRKGCEVAGYDKVSTSLTDELMAEGIDVHFLDDTMNLPAWTHEVSADVLIVYTPAIPKDHVEYNFLKDIGYTPRKRSEVLGMITKESVTVAVAGTHGKTTTSSLLAHIFTETNFGCNAFLGGIATNYNSNVLLNPDSDTVVVEADEYDRSFLTLYPDVAIVTSMDADHLDIYGEKDQLEESFKLFVNQIKEGGKLIRKAGLSLSEGITYSITGDADYQALEIDVVNGQYKFSLKHPGGIINDVTVGLPGSHNVENAIAAFAVACELGIEIDLITKALHSFQGVKRRFEYHIKSANLVYIDDYAHHPEELKACIQSVREMYPNKKITGVFQPHLYSRTRDFADGFAESLSELNEVILLDIYPARELPIEGITSSMLLDKITSTDKLLLGKKEVVEDLQDRELEVLLTLGAGDIDELVKPIKEGLEAQV